MSLQNTLLVALAYPSTLYIGITHGVYKIPNENIVLFEESAPIILDNVKIHSDLYIVNQTNLQYLIYG